MGSILIDEEDARTVADMAVRLYVVNTAGMAMVNKDNLREEHMRKAAKDALRLFLAVCEQIVAYDEDPTA